MRLAPLAALWLAAIGPASAQGIGLGPLDSTGRAALDTGLDLLAATLANALRSSQEQARQAGTQPIPPQIHAALLTWYPADLLQGIDYRVGVGVGADTTLQSWSIRYGDAVAVTTIDTITFANAFDATNDVALWAHEVTHVEQFRRWGVMDFARRYVRDHLAVEREALAAAEAFRAAYDAGAWRGAPATDIPATGTALVCATPEGACVMGTALAPGKSCFCPSDRGRIPGLSQ